ncbi:MAG: LamG domain-containing protein [Mariniphaga sp.]
MKNKSVYCIVVLSGLLLPLLTNCIKEPYSKVPSVTISAITNITPTSATSGGVVTRDGGAKVTAIGICWSTNQNPTILDAKTSDASTTGIFTSFLKGLTPGITYYVKAYATNTVGTGYSSQLAFSTGVLAPTITTLDLSAISPTSATGGGNIATDGGSMILMRGVCWSKNQNPTTADSKTSDGTGSGSYTSAITGLAPGGIYYVRAYATNSAGTAYGAQINFTSIDITTGLVAYFPFNGNANDESGNGNNGTEIQSVVYTQDRNNIANSAFQAGAGYITAPSGIFQFQRDQQFTVSVWFTTVGAASSGRLLSNESPEGHFRIAGPDGNGTIGICYGDYIFDTVSANSWHNYIYSYDNRNEKIYVDGVLKHTNYDLAIEVLNYSSPFTIGAKAAWNWDKWSGKIDDVRIYNRTLSSQDAIYLYSH